ncbi:MAG: hypothetical protein P8J28_04695, partial [Polaribacter sp.]|nr:hypothetical protein [Polaribacter sp.]
MKFKNSFIYILFVLIAYSCSTKEEHIVKVFKRQILVNDAPYLIKGICYHPVPKGSPNKRDFSSLKEDILLMKEAGINTIRVYAPIDDIAVLDQLALADIKVIIGFGYDQKGFYDIASGSFIEYVEKYKTHK